MPTDINDRLSISLFWLHCLLVSSLTNLILNHPYHTHCDFTHQSRNFLIYFFIARICPSGFAILSINLKLLFPRPRFLFASISLIYYSKYCKFAVHSCSARWHAAADDWWTYDLLPNQFLLRTCTTNDGLAYLTLRLLMSYIYGGRILDVSRSHTTTQHSR